MVKKKRRLKYKNIIMCLVIIFVVILGTILLIKGFSNNKGYFSSNDDVLEKNSKDKGANEEKDKDKIYKASMVMVGDNIIHESVYRDAKNNANGKGYDFKPMYEMVKPIIGSYDIAYVNQETIIGGNDIGVSGYPSFNSPYETGDDLIDTGFNLVSLATNHSMDSGVQAVINSRNYWKGKSNVLTSGSYLSNEDRDNVDIREVNGITYTMLNYTYGTNGYGVREDYLVNVWPTSNLSMKVTHEQVSNDSKYQAYKEVVRKDIEKVRDKVDVLIVAMHWGVEYSVDATEYQKDEAKFLADLGVDIIIGTHPHIIEPVEWIGDTLVYYSLGNFLSSQYQTDYYNKVVGLMGSLDIVKTVHDGKSSIKIDNVCNELLYTYYKEVGDYRTNIKIIPFSKMSDEYLKDYQKVYDKYKGVVQKYDSNICVK